jgi:hypothetical protein
VSSHIREVRTLTWEWEVYHFYVCDLGQVNSAMGKKILVSGDFPCILRNYY